MPLILFCEGGDYLTTADGHKISARPDIIVHRQADTAPVAFSRNIRHGYTLLDFTSRPFTNWVTARSFLDEAPRAYHLMNPVCRRSVVYATVQLSPGSPLLRPSPLLKEERHAPCETLVPNG